LLRRRRRAKALGDDDIIEAVIDGDEFVRHMLKALGDITRETVRREMRRTTAAIERRLEEQADRLGDLAVGYQSVAKAVGELADMGVLVKAMADQQDAVARTTPATTSRPTGVAKPVERPSDNGSGKPDPALLAKAVSLFERGLELRAQGRDIPVPDAFHLSHGQVSAADLQAFIRAVEEGA